MTSTVQTPWNVDALSAPPATTAAEGFDEAGVRAIFYDGLPWRGRSTRVFAWVGVPECAKEGPVPGMVLAHGGGGTAFAEWVRLWTSRGYAAITMDTCGCVPVGEYANWQRHPDGGPAGWGGFAQIDEPWEDQWSYHAVADVILAHSLLRALPEVDAGRIGLTGISWGGYLTGITAGMDVRFRFAVPVYGCGFLGEDSTWLPIFAQMGEERAAKWLGQWDPSVYLPRAMMPMLWVTGTNDFAYPMGSLRKSYRLPAGPRTLCIRVSMPHGHGGPGENPEEIRAAADSLLSGGTPLVTVTSQGSDGSAAWVSFTTDVPVVRAELNYTSDNGPWQPRAWTTVEAELDTTASIARANVPTHATAYYLNLIDARGLVVSGEHVEP